MRRWGMPLLAAGAIGAAARRKRALTFDGALGATLVRGWTWMTNDAVNAAATAAGSVVGAVLMRRPRRAAG